MIHEKPVQWEPFVHRWIDKIIWGDKINSDLYKKTKTPLKGDRNNF